MKKWVVFLCLPAMVLGTLICTDYQYVAGQEITNRDKHFAKLVLNVVARDINDLYFDKSQLDRNEYKKRIDEVKRQLDEAESINQLYGIIGQLFLEFDEVGTFFMSPVSFRYPEYGFQWDMIGEKCYVTYVDPKSEAARSGVRKGDQVLKIHKYIPSRDNAWKIRYTYTMVRPITKMPVELKRIDGKVYTVELTTQFINKPNKQISIEDIIQYQNSMYEKSPNCYDLIDKGNIVVIKNIESVKCLQSIRTDIFSAIAKNDVIDRRNEDSQDSDNVGLKRNNRTITNFKQYKGVIFDLRDCCTSDYSFDNAQKLLSNFVDKRTKLIDQYSRGKTKSIYISPSGDSSFVGNQVLILVNSQTRSIGEIIARFMQIEGIAKIIGDRTRGNVKISEYIFDSQHIIPVGHSSSLIFFSSITTNDVIFSDKVKIDRLGVTPDVEIIPDSRDVMLGRDIVMSYALRLYGYNVSPEVAGKIFTTSVTNWMFRYL